MQCEIVMIGTELLLGQIVDTNAAFMARTLAENGLSLYQKTTVGDNAERICRVLDAALDRSDVVLTSGGLGPTEDDLTRECVAQLLDRPLEFRQELYDDLVARFAHLSIRLTDNNKKQAYAPRGATALENPNGTAPGLLVEDERGTVVCMPGVPRELEAMLADTVIPHLRRAFELPGVIHSRVLKVCGLGESRVDAAIGGLVRSQQNPTVGLLASPDAVRIRITARAGDVAEAEALIDKVDAQVRERLPGLVMGVGDTTLEQVVDGLLRERGWRLAVAETATGGAMAQRITAARAQAFAGAVVVPLASMDGLDAARAARELAEQVRAQHVAECALALTADREARRTHVHFATPEGCADWDFGYWGRSNQAQVRAGIVALEHVRRHLSGIEV